MASKSWKFIVYETDGTTEDFTITNSQLVSPPTIPSTRAQLLEGRVEAVSFDIEVGDFSDFISDKLDDSDNRMELQGRLVEAQIDTGSGFTTVWKGRWVGAAETEGPGKYSVRLSQEHWKTRNADIFETQDTCVIWPQEPHGLKDEWRPFLRFKEAQEAIGLVEEVTADYVKITPITSSVVFEIEELAAFIREDLLPNATFITGKTEGNFRHLRATTDGTAREILGFNTATPTGTRRVDLSYFLAELNEEEPSWPTFVWLVWGSGQPSPGDVVALQFTMDDAPPASMIPLHIGGVDGVDPIAYLKTLYDDQGVQYESDAFSAYDPSTNPNGLIDHPSIPRMWWRITAPQKLGPWSEQSIYKPLGLVPFVNSEGEIAPRFAFLPKDVDPSTLTVIDTSNTATDGHPTWQHSGTEAITDIRISRPAAIRAFRNMRSGSGLPIGQKPEIGSPRSDESAGGSVDKINVEERHLEPIQHDKISTVGSRKQEVFYSGIWNHFDAEALADTYARELFDRYGDGPQFGSFKGLSSLDTLEAGDFVLIDFDTFPNAQATGGRGGERVVQLTGVSHTPFGPDFDFVDAGPNEQPLSAPDVAISQGSDDGRQQVSVTVSSLDSDATHWTLELRVGAGGTWYVYVANIPVGTTTVTVEGLPAGETMYARAYVTAPLRIRSAYSTTDNAALASLTAPSSLGTTVDGTSIVLTWTNGEDDKPVMPVILEGTAGTPADAIKYALAPGTTEFVFSELEESTEYTVGVYHLDEETDGQSSQTTTTETTSTKNTLVEPKRVVVLQGRGTNTNTEYAEDAIVLGEGLEIGFRAGNAHASFYLQVATDSNFSTVVREKRVEAGINRISILGLNLATTYFVRVKHIRPGFTDSGWTAAVSAKATRVLKTSLGEDSFAAGSARLYLDSGVLKVFIDSVDNDTDRVFFEAIKNPGGSPPYPDVDDSTVNEEVRADLPYDDDALDSSGAQITMDSGDVAYITIGFYNDVSGFGSFVYDVWEDPESVIVPSVLEDATVSGGVASIDLTIADPQLRVTAVEFQEKTGAGDFGGTWVDTWDRDTGTAGTDETLERGEDITLTSKHTIALKYRVAYMDLDSNTQYVGGVVPVDVDDIPEIWDCSISFNSDGEVQLAVEGDDDVERIYANVGNDSVPGDPTNLSADGSVIASGGFISTSVFVDIGNEAIVKVVGYDDTSGGNPGPVRIFRKRRGDATNRTPQVRANVGQSGATGSLDLTILDPTLSVTFLAFSKKTGAGGFSSFVSTWDRTTGTAGTNTTLTRGEDISLSDKHISTIKVQISYTDEDGTNQTWENSWDFDADEIAEVTGIEIDFNADGEAVVSATGDEDTDDLYVTVGNGSTPADPTAGTNDGSISGRSGSVDTGIAITTGNEAIVKVVASSDTTGLGPVQTAKFSRRMGPFHKDTSTRSLTGTTTTTTLETITVPAGKLGTKGMLRLNAYLEFSGTNGQKIVTVDFGGSQFHSIGLAASFEGRLRIEVLLFNDGSASVQQMLTTAWSSGPSYPGSGDLFVDPGATSVNTGSAADLRVRGRLINASDSISLQITTVEYLGTS